MVEHQKYFPVADKNGQLKNLFIITADNTPNNIIRKGNQNVLSARLADGVFLYEQDLLSPLEKFNEKLKNMTFQKDLGSMLQKVTRICCHASAFNQHLEIADDSKLFLAALLCKADLASLLVGEFPELQGTVGKYYALAQNEDPEVASAIEEHWMPKGENTSLPKTPCGIAVSLADKIDNLIGYYSVGLKPTSSSDPYALRRQTIVLRILIEDDILSTSGGFLHECSFFFPSLRQTPQVKEKIIEEILDFITNRAKSVFEDYGFKKMKLKLRYKGSAMIPMINFVKSKLCMSFVNRAKSLPNSMKSIRELKDNLPNLVKCISIPPLLGTCRKGASSSARSSSPTLA